jgi:hypothetical protein
LLLSAIAGLGQLRTGESITVAFPKGTVPFSSNDNWDSPPLIHSPVLTVARSEDFRLAARPFVRRRDIADRPVQSHVIAMLDIRGHDPRRVLERDRRAGPDALALDAPVKSLQLAVALRIVRACAHVGMKNGTSRIIGSPVGHNP